MALQRGYSPGQFRAKILGEIGPFTVTATIPSTATTVNGFVNVTVPSGLGLQIGDCLFVVPPAAAVVAGVALEAIVVNSTTISLVCNNGSGGPYNPGVQTYTIFGFRVNPA